MLSCGRPLWRHLHSKQNSSIPVDYCVVFLDIAIVVVLTSCTVECTIFLELNIPFQLISHGILVDICVSYNLAIFLLIVWN